MTPSIQITELIRNGQLLRAGKISGQLSTAPSKDFSISVARGEVRGYAGTHKFGYNSDVDTTSTPEDVWDNGGAYPGFIAAADTVKVQSTSTADDGDPAGTGAQKVKVFGVDSTWALQEEEVTLNGTSTVNLASQYLRVFRMYVTDVGSGGVNAGTIILTDSSSNRLAQIGAGNGQTLMAIYTVPLGCTGYITQIDTSIGKQTSAYAEWDLQSRIDGESWRVRHRDVTTQAGTTVVRLDPPITVPEKTDIRLRVTNVSANNTSVTSSFGIYCVDDGA